MSFKKYYTFKQTKVLWLMV